MQTFKKLPKAKPISIIKIKITVLISNYLEVCLEYQAARVFDFSLINEISEKV